MIKITQQEQELGTEEFLTNDLFMCRIKMQNENKQYQIGKHFFTQKDLSLREDEKVAKIIDEVFGVQLKEYDKQHENNLKNNFGDAPFIQTQFVNDSVIITGGFLSKLLETRAATKIAAMFLIPDQQAARLFLLLWKIKAYRLNYFSKNIKGKLKADIFTDFFLDGTVYAANLVNHFLKLLSIRIAQMEELKAKDSDSNSEKRKSTN